MAIWTSVQLPQQLFKGDHMYSFHTQIFIFDSTEVALHESDFRIILVFLILDCCEALCFLSKTSQNISLKATPL